ncbi:MAG TPA: TIGR00266 family protein [Thermomicrobiales bacterium]|nr:TIGR00266 family protein [Thermomicrobiales bacterium]
MQTQVLYQPAYALAIVTLAGGEQIRADSGAMVSMDDGITVETAATGGFLKSIGRSFLGGESFFQNTFTAGSSGGVITLAPDLPGDIMVVPLNGEIIVQSGSYLAGSLSIDVNSKWGGAKSFFGGEGLFMLRCSGQGDLIVSSYGAIHKVTLEAGRRYTIDTGHIVAFGANMTYEIKKVGSWKSTIFGGEGLVASFAGPGDLYLQSRSPEAFLGWLIPKLPRRDND